MNLTPTLRRNKFNAEAVMYNGVRYASKLDRNIAIRIDFLKGPVGIIQDWEYEIRFTLPGFTPKRKKYLTHKVDFKVTLPAKGAQGKVLYLEAKGMRHRDGETRRAWVEHEFGIRIHVVGSVKAAESVILEESQ